MKPRTSLWAFAIFALLCLYLSLGTASITPGMNNPRFQFMNLIMISGSSLIWLLARWRSRWKWHVTPFDGAIVLWAVAIAASILANTDLWRRIAIGAWYAALYILIWYALQDILANRVLSREMLVNFMLGTSAILIFTALNQLVNWGSVFLALRSYNDVYIQPISDILRIHGTLEQPNRLAVVLVSVLPLGLARLLTAQKWITRLFWAGYAALSLLTLVFTFSRGGWLACIVAIAAFVALLMAHYGLFSPQKLRAWWMARSNRARILVSGVAILGVVGAIAAGLILLRISTTASRQSDQRGELWQIALRLFGEKPLTGYGLFTMGYGVLRLQPFSIPPSMPHSDAHNAILNTAAELGLLGLLAMAIAFVVYARSAWRNWQTMQGAQRIMLAGAIAGMAGFVFQHQTEVGMLTAMVAITGIAMMAVAVTPITPVRIPESRRSLRTVLMVALPLVLLVAGFGSNAAYNRYFSGLLVSASTGDLKSAVADVQSAIDSDPAMPAYHLQEGLLLGIVADKGDNDARSQAIEAYKRFINLEPYYAPAWANLGGLHWQAGEREQAVKAMERAVQLAPEGWQFAYNLGRYYEALGNTEAARRAYEQALESFSIIRFLPDWQESELRRAVVASYRPKTELTTVEQAVGEIADPKKARTIFTGAPESQRQTVRGHTVSLILLLESGEPGAEQFDQVKAAENAETRIAKLLGYTIEAESWREVAEAYLKFSTGDKTGASEALKKASDLAADFPGLGIDIISSNYYRIGVAKSLVPQLYAPGADPLLLYFIDRLERKLG